jgi:hypothetical protein
VRITPTDTTPLSNGDSPDPPRPRPKPKKAQPPNQRATPAANSSGAVRVDGERRNLPNSGPGSGTNSPPQTKPPQAKAPQAEPPRTKAEPTKAEPNADSRPKIKVAPEPVWAPEPLRTPKPTASLDRATDAPPRVPNWERGRAATSQSDAQWDGAEGPTSPEIPVHAPPHARRRRLPRSRAFVTVAVVLCFLVAVVAGVAIVSAFHNPAAPKATPGTTSISHVSSPAIARVQAATTTAEAATTAARSDLTTIPGIPTVSSVAAVVNPYVESLQHYQDTLTNTAVPASAKTAVDSLRSLVSQDARFIFTINVLPSLGLGAYLAEFEQRSVQLESALHKIRGTLDEAAG